MIIGRKYTLVDINGSNSFDRQILTDEMISSSDGNYITGSSSINKRKIKSGSSYSADILESADVDTIVAIVVLCKVSGETTPSPFSISIDGSVSFETSSLIMEGMTSSPNSLFVDIPTTELELELTTIIINE